MSSNVVQLGLGVELPNESTNAGSKADTNFNTVETERARRNKLQNENYYLLHENQQLGYQIHNDKIKLQSMEGKLKKIRNDPNTMKAIFERLHLLYYQLDTLTQSLAGICGSFAFTPPKTGEEKVRLLLDYLYPCKTLDPRLDGLFGAILEIAVGLRDCPENINIPPPPGFSELIEKSAYPWILNNDSPIYIRNIFNPNTSGSALLKTQYITQQILEKQAQMKTEGLSSIPLTGFELDFGELCFTAPNSIPTSREIMILCSYSTENAEKILYNNDRHVGVWRVDKNGIARIKKKIFITELPEKKENEMPYFVFDLFDLSNAKNHIGRVKVSFIDQKTLYYFSSYPILSSSNGTEIGVLSFNLRAIPQGSMLPAQRYIEFVQKKQTMEENEAKSKEYTKLKNEKLGGVAGRLSSINSTNSKLSNLDSHKTIGAISKSQYKKVQSEESNSKAATFVKKLTANKNVNNDKLRLNKVTTNVGLSLKTSVPHVQGNNIKKQLSKENANISTKIDTESNLSKSKVKAAPKSISTATKTDVNAKQIADTSNKAVDDNLKADKLRIKASLPTDSETKTNELLEEKEDKNTVLINGTKIVVESKKDDLGKKTINVVKAPTKITPLEALALNNPVVNKEVKITREEAIRRVIEAQEPDVSVFKASELRKRFAANMQPSVAMQKAKSKAITTTAKEKAKDNKTGLSKSILAKNLQTGVMIPNKTIEKSSNSVNQMELIENLNNSLDDVKSVKSKIENKKVLASTLKHSSTSNKVDSKHAKNFKVVVKVKTKAKVSSKESVSKNGSSESITRKTMKKESEQLSSAKRSNSNSLKSSTTSNKNESKTTTNKNLSKSIELRSNKNINSETLSSTKKSTMITKQLSKTSNKNIVTKSIDAKNSNSSLVTKQINVEKAKSKADINNVESSITAKKARIESAPIKMKSISSR